MAVSLEKRVDRHAMVTTPDLDAERSLALLPEDRAFHRTHADSVGETCEPIGQRRGRGVRGRHRDPKETPAARRVFQDRDLGGFHALGRDRVADRREKGPRLPGDRFAVLRPDDAVRSRSEVSDAGVGAAAGDVQPRAEPVFRRGRQDGRLCEQRRVQPADPMHRLHEQFSLGAEGRRRAEMRPVASRTGGVRGFQPVARRFEHAAQTPPPEPFAPLIDTCLDELSGKRAVDESHAVGCARDPLSGRGELLDADAADGPLRGLRDSICPASGPPGHSSERRGSSSVSLTARRDSARRVFSAVTGSIRSPAPDSRCATWRSSAARSSSGRDS